MMDIYGQALVESGLIRPDEAARKRSLGSFQTRWFSFNWLSVVYLLGVLVLYVYRYSMKLYIPALPSINL
jgi:hypothetical protein